MIGDDRKQHLPCNIRCCQSFEDHLHPQVLHQQWVYCILTMKNITTNFKFSLTEQLGLHHTFLGRISEMQISDNQLFSVTKTNLKHHKIHLICCLKSTTSSLDLFYRMKDISRVVVIAILISLPFRLHRIFFNLMRLKTINRVVIAKRLHFRSLFIRFADLIGFLSCENQSTGSSQ